MKHRLEQRKKEWGGYKSDNTGRQKAKLISIFGRGMNDGWNESKTCSILKSQPHTHTESVLYMHTIHSPRSCSKIASGSVIAFAAVGRDLCSWVCEDVCLVTVKPEPLAIWFNGQSEPQTPLTPQLSVGEAGQRINNEWKALSHT